ncbi:MAG: MIP/aquaporin family protein [Saprospiraceae bacterium]
MTPFIGEIFGTFVLILMGQGVNANNSLKATYAQNTGWVLITFGWAMAVFAAVTVSSEASGAHLNPAVTIGLAMAGKFAWSNVASYIAAQIIGAMLGSLAVWLMYRDHYNATEEAAGVLGTFSTGPAIANNFTNVLSEVLGTFVLVAAVLYATSPNFITEGSVTPGLGAIGALPVALIVLGVGISLGGTTGYAINPARDLGPRIMHSILPITHKGGSNWGYAWIPIIGPITGALLAGAFYIAFL